MKLDISALALTCGLIWGGAVLVVAVANQLWSPYGGALLNLAASIYPGYHPSGGVGSVVTGTAYALVDGGVGGAIFAWLYNSLARRRGADPG